MEYLHAARAITGDGKTVLMPAWIGIEGEHIKIVSESKPEGTRVENTTELGEATITPGLMNIHDHISRKSLRFPGDGKNTFGERANKLMANDPSYLILHSYVNMKRYLTDEGITYVRDQGLTGYTSIELRRAIEEGLLEGPTISACGMSISITGGHCHKQSMEADGADAVRRAVRIQIQRGADVIKLMGSGGLEQFPTEDPTIPQFTVEELAAAVQAAHDAGLDTAIHAYSTEGILRALKAGVDHIEHGTMMTGECIELMAKNGAVLNPTMTGIRGAAAAGPNIKYWDMLEERVFSRQEEGMRMAKKAGILIGAGTDTAGTLADEIAMIGKTLGETPVEAIGHATGTNAIIARRPDMGLLREGNLADLAAFDGDLTVSLNGLKKVICTWRHGKVYKRAPEEQR